MKIALLLIALGFGYKVFADACKENGGIKKLGQVIGILVMVGSLLCMICFAWFYAKACSGGYGWNGKGFCPFSQTRGVVAPSQISEVPK